MKTKRLALFVGALLVAAIAIYGLTRGGGQAAPIHVAPLTPVATPVAVVVDNSPFGMMKGVLDNYCIRCHSEGQTANDLPLTFKDEKEALARAEDDPEFWQTVGRMVETKEMPPRTARAKPTDVERAHVSQWITGLYKGNGEPNPGRFILHRLNNREYANTIRDLFFLPEDWDPTADFPADERGDGFDNNSDTLTFSPILLERYLEAAEKTIIYALNIDNKGNSASKARINLPLQGYREDFADWQEKARVVVTVMLPRVYRRLVTKEEIDEVMKFGGLALTHDGESISRATGYPLRAALMSPEFLFRMERDPNDDGTGKIYEIDDFALASRLSYFLWATMPDDELFITAQDKKLRAGLEDQVRRMLKSPKAISLTRDFMGQWLEIRSLEKTTTNCPPELLAAMKAETEHFFNYIVQEDRSIMEFLDADYTFLNQKLAEHYGMTGITGNEFRKVQVDPEQRGGIFTQASFLTHTAKPLGSSRRTSAVNRGKWILENIFNTKIPPPPPNVPSLAVDDGKELKGTVRQILEQHRENPDCISCHSRMDPYGFALENYDGFGVWRTLDNNVKVDTSGEINGVKYSTPREFRTILAGRKNEFRRALVTKMLSYALTRGIKTYDQPVIDEICAAVEKDGDRFSSVILHIARSYPFQHARSSVTIKKEETQ